MQFEDIDQAEAKKFIKRYWTDFIDLGLNWDKIRFWLVKNEDHENLQSYYELMLSSRISLIAKDASQLGFINKLNVKKHLLITIKKILEWQEQFKAVDLLYNLDAKQLFAHMWSDGIDYQINLVLEKNLIEVDWNWLIDFCDRLVKTYCQTNFYLNSDLFLNNKYDAVIIVYKQNLNSIIVNLYDSEQGTTVYQVDATILNAYYDLKPLL